MQPALKSVGHADKTGDIICDATAGSGQGQKLTRRCSQCDAVARREDVIPEYTSREQEWKKGNVSSAQGICKTITE